MSFHLDGSVTYSVYGSSHTGGMYVKAADGETGAGADGATGAVASGSDPRAGGSDPRPRTKAEQREATTAALIASARALFAERGYAGVGTEEIVQHAGVTRGALYHHFKGGKEDLFRAVLVQVSAETARHVMAAGMSTDDPWEALVLGSEAFLDAAMTAEVQRIMLVDGPSVLGWDVWRAADADYALGMIEGALQHAIDAGRLVPQPAKALAHVLLGALDEAAMVVARADDPEAARAEMGQTMRRLLEGLRGPTL
ncbi:MAG TPA: TetR/AcrR family transcriptional regulator [Solirubrobacteraceae bacterium]|nr:TetR/AcrR family transcriptional regulator [Solirubrobacteraceae bacterium]